MNTSTIIKELSQRLDLPQTEIKRVYDSTFDAIKKSLGKQKGLVLQNFGSFSVKKRDRRKSFNPFKNIYIILPPKMVLSFKPSAALKAKVKNRRVE